MTTTLVWAIVLLLVGLGLLVAEVFIPSGGILGILTGVALVASLILAFSEGLVTGLVFLVIVAVAVPAGIVVGMHIWPKTPIGRWVSLQPGTVDGDEPAALSAGLDSLVGQVGRTITPLRPSGLTDFAGRRVDTVTEGFLIEPGTWVRVVHVEGRRVVVRPVEPEELGA